MREDKMGNTDGLGLIIYSGSRDELQMKLRARDDRITALETCVKAIALGRKKCASGTQRICRDELKTIARDACRKLDIDWEK